MRLDIIKLFIFACIIGIFVGCFTFLFYWIGKANVYSDTLNNQRMEACVEKGYSWGACYDVIIRGTHTFAQ